MTRLNRNLGKDSAELGEDDVVQGTLKIYGATTTNGGTIEIYNAADEDTTVGYWKFEPDNTKLYIGNDVDSDAYTFSTSGFGIGTSTFDASVVNYITIINGTEPTAATVDQIYIGSKDSSDGAANATLSLYTEQTVEVIGTFTASHKLKMWINGIEYWIQLDAVA